MQSEKTEKIDMNDPRVFLPGFVKITIVSPWGLPCGPIEGSIQLDPNLEHENPKRAMLSALCDLFEIAKRQVDRKAVEE